MLVIVLADLGHHLFKKLHGLPTSSLSPDQSCRIILDLWISPSQARLVRTCYFCVNGKGTTWLIRTCFRPCKWLASILPAGFVGIADLGRLCVFINFLPMRDRSWLSLELIWDYCFEVFMLALRRDANIHSMGIVQGYCCCTHISAVVWKPQRWPYLSIMHTMQNVIAEMRLPPWLSSEEKVDPSISCDFNSPGVVWFRFDGPPDVYPFELLASGLVSFGVCILLNFHVRVVTGNQAIV